VEAANGALRGNPNDDQATMLGEVTTRCERALRRHRVGS
jgi:hypothetical protein